jgi:putative peptide zinc metalloprotease protein
MTDTNRATNHTLRLLLALPAVVAALACAQAAPAGDGGGHGQDNSAIAVNTKDNTSLSRFAFKVKTVRGDVVDAKNTAVAYAQCNDCRTTAIAFEIVLVMNSPSQVTPTNLAFAYNDECTRCQTLASAYQFVIGRGYPIRFAPDARGELAGIKNGLKGLSKSDDMPLDQLQARIDELAGRVRTILDTELVPANGDEDTPDEDDTTGSAKTLTTPPVVSASKEKKGGETDVIRRADESGS